MDVAFCVKSKPWRESNEPDDLVTKTPVESPCEISAGNNEPENLYFCFVNFSEKNCERVYIKTFCVTVKTYFAFN